MTNEDPDTARDVEKGDELIQAAEERAQDPQSAIDHDLYPASARPSGLEVLMAKDNALTCFKCGDGNTPLYCLNCANDQLKAQVESLEKQIKLACEDWAEDDTAIRNLCRPFLTEQTCDHDGYAVVPVVDAVQNALDTLEKQCAAMRERLEELLEVHEFIESDHEVNGVPAFHQTTATKAVLDSTTAGRDYFKVCPRCRYPATTARDIE